MFWFCVLLALTERSFANAYEHIEASFSITNLPTNPFDYTVTDVEVQMTQPDGSTVTLPAFFDGGTTWRVRHTPMLPGVYQITNITMNGSTVAVGNLQPTSWTVAGNPISPGYIQVDPTNSNRFITSNGRRYFPVGENVAWDQGSTGIVTNVLARLGPVHANWARIWMAPWDGTSLETGYGAEYSLGVIPMAAADKWDNIVSAAEQNGISFQMVLENFVEYNTATSFTFWSQNPWNAANGGFLSSPQQYFTNATATTLTKQMMRYAVARWGYSPSIMAWELFNEVENTDAINVYNQTNTVHLWHDQMAEFIRSQDKYHHLITTSSELILPIWDQCDYYQHHDYPEDLVSGLRNADPTPLPLKPNFGGECDTNNPAHIGVCVPLWTGLMNGQSGNDQPWWWDGIDAGDDYIYFESVSDFIRLSGIPGQNSIQQAAPAVNSPGSALSAYQIGNNEFAALWIWQPNNIFASNPTTSASGTFPLSGLQTGNYVGTWWDTFADMPISNFTFTATTGNPVTVATPSILRALALYVGTAPQAGVIATNLTVSLGTNSLPFTLPITITNGGGLPLTYSLSVTGATSVAYTAINSTQPGGPVFQWRDISAIGDNITTNLNTLVGSKSPLDEGIGGPINIGFGFPFFSTAQSSGIYTQVYISTDGFVTFSPFSGDQSTNLALPNASAPTNLIALFWTDLVFGNTGSLISTESDPLEGTFTIQFQNAQLKSGTGTVTGQIILKSSGEILLEYRAINATNTGTIGVQNAAANAGLTVAFNQRNYPPSNFAISLTPVPWLGLSAWSGIVPNANADTINVSFNPAGLSPGTNKASILITTGDTNHPAFTVPVELDVSPPVAPVLATQTTYGPGGFSLSFSGSNGQSYRVLMSTNLSLPLSNWAVLTNGIFGAGVVNFTDTAATNGGRFYCIGSP